LWLPQRNRQLTQAKTTNLPLSEQHRDVPLFVFTGFNEDNAAKHSKLLGALMAWAHEVTRGDLAKVLLVTNDSNLSDSINRLLPSRVESIELHDVDFYEAVEVGSCTHILLATLCCHRMWWLLRSMFNVGLVELWLKARPTAWRSLVVDSKILTSWSVWLLLASHMAQLLTTSSPKRSCTCVTRCSVQPLA
jgi:hypothetical protein